MPTYVLRDGQLVLKEHAPPPRSAGPHLIRDIEPYVSPVGDHAVVGSRSARREDMRRHGCIDYREVKGQTARGFHSSRRA